MSDSDSSDSDGYDGYGYRSAIQSSKKRKKRKKPQKKHDEPSEECTPLQNPPKERQHQEGLCPHCKKKIEGGGYWGQNSECAVTACISGYSAPFCSKECHDSWGQEKENIDFESYVEAMDNTGPLKILSTKLFGLKKIHKTTPLDLIFLNNILHFRESSDEDIERLIREYLEKKKLNSLEEIFVIVGQHEIVLSPSISYKTDRYKVTVCRFLKEKLRDNRQFVRVYQKIIDQKIMQEEDEEKEKDKQRGEAM